MALRLLPVLLCAAAASAATNTTLAFQSAVLSACSQIENAISHASGVFYPPNPTYMKDLYHYATTSDQDSICSVEPGTPEDLSAMLQILAQTRTPFGVKGGGHMMNPGASSSAGVQIAMSRFSAVQYDPAAQTAAVGAGLVWDDVYAALAPLGVNVVGGRVTGIGVAGFTLGGGYSWKTNQYGLTLDTVEAFELVLPNGTVAEVTARAHPDLFFGLKGGFNNFGIVTKFTLRTHPQTEVWGGQVVISQEYAAQVKAATLRFSSEATDPRAAMLINVMYIDNAPLFVLVMFYDAPARPAWIFDDFLDIPYIEKNISTRSFLSVVQISAVTTVSYRGLYGTVPLQDVTPAIFDAMVNQTQYWSAHAAALSINQLAWAIEPFLPGILAHGAPSAYPASRAQRFLPININALWSDAADDGTVAGIVAESTALIAAAALGAGEVADAAALQYPNYAAADTQIEAMYGENVPALMALRQQYDPADVMGLAGGWKFSV